VTHDLMASTFGELGISVSRIVSLPDGRVFFAACTEAERRDLDIDSRPSDAIALACASSPDLRRHRGAGQGRCRAREGQEDRSPRSWTRTAAVFRDLVTASTCLTCRRAAPRPSRGPSPADPAGSGRADPPSRGRAPPGAVIGVERERRTTPPASGRWRWSPSAPACSRCWLGAVPRQQDRSHAHRRPDRDRHRLPGRAILRQGSGIRGLTTAARSGSWPRSAWRRLRRVRAGRRHTVLVWARSCSCASPGTGCSPRSSCGRGGHEEREPGPSAWWRTACADSQIGAGHHAHDSSGCMVLGDPSMSAKRRDRDDSTRLFATWRGAEITSSADGQLDGKSYATASTSRRSGLRADGRSRGRDTSSPRRAVRRGVERCWQPRRGDLLHISGKSAARATPPPGRDMTRRPRAVVDTEVSRCARAAHAGGERMAAAVSPPRRSCAAGAIQAGMRSTSCGHSSTAQGEDGAQRAPGLGPAGQAV